MSRLVYEIPRDAYAYARARAISHMCVIIIKTSQYSFEYDWRFCQYVRSIFVCVLRLPFLNAGLSHSQKLYNGNFDVKTKQKTMSEAEAEI